MQKYPLQEIQHKIDQSDSESDHDGEEAAHQTSHRFFNSNVSEIWPTETASDSLKTGVTKKLISQELKHISLSCKKHWKAYLILL